MEIKEILTYCDHTLLAPTATWEQVKALCEEAMAYHTASVCIPAAYVRQAKEYVEDRLPICTVIGFPNGYDTTAAKCFMAYDAVGHGADEVDMVVNLGWVKDGRFEEVTEEIRQVKAHCCGKILKVIVEACLLTQQEKIALCKAVTQAGADYIKTSTGFSQGGATVADVELFARHIGEDVKIKAAGGIQTPDQAQAFFRAGAHRLGTSRLVKFAKAQDESLPVHKEAF